MNQYFHFEPVRSLAALQVLVQAILVSLFAAGVIDGIALAVSEGVQAPLFVFLSTFVRGAVVPTASLDKLAELPPPQLAELVRLKELDER